MKNKQSFNRLSLLIVLVCCYQKIWAGVVMKAEIITNITKEAKDYVQEPKTIYKSKTTTATSTEKTILETTTLPLDFNSDADGRSAFINNEFVAENEDSTVYTSPPLYDVLQQQTSQDYNNELPQMNGNIKAEKLSEKPIFGHDMGLFSDYEEEDIIEYGPESNYAPEHCEDSQESPTKNDEGKKNAVASYQTGFEKEITDNSESNIFEQDLYNKPNESNSYGLITNTNQGSLFGSDNTSQNGYKTSKPKQQWYHNNNNGGIKLEIKPNNEYLNLNNYDQINLNMQYQQGQQAALQHHSIGEITQKPFTNKNSHDKREPQRNRKPYSNKEKSTQNLFYNQKPTQNSTLYGKQQQQQLQYTKPGQSLNNKLPYNTISNNSYSNAELIVYANGNLNNYLPDTFNSSNPALTPNFSHDNVNTSKPSQFSNTSGNNKNFHTISSSIQYVSTPFADLVFKYSIGMAKLSNSKIGSDSFSSQAQMANALSDNDNIKG